MESLNLQSLSTADFTPAVHLDARSGDCTLSGESYIEDAPTFYERIKKWVDEYTSTGNPLKFEFSITYFNTNSSKCLLQLLMKMRDYQEQGGDVKAIWYYDPQDEDMKEEIQDLQDESGLSIAIEEKPNLLRSYS